MTVAAGTLVAGGTITTPALRNAGEIQVQGTLTAGSFSNTGTPDHAVFVHDMLVPVKCLVEGAGIAQVPVDRVSYWHVELAQHAVLLAEGLPVESLLPGGDRLGFANSRIVTLHPDGLALRWEGEDCAPLVVAGPKLQAIRSMLARRVQPSPTEQKRAG